jgi:hypothetical protein
MAHSRGWLVALAAATAAPATAFAVALPDDVTIRAQLSTDPGTGTYELDISGTIASNASGETVDVLAKECGPANRHYRLVAGARTAAGGSWVVVTGRGGVDLVQLPINAYFRARWRDISVAPCWFACRRLRAVLRAAVQDAVHCKDTGADAPRPRAG